MPWHSTTANPSLTRRSSREHNQRQPNCHKSISHVVLHQGPHTFVVDLALTPPDGRKRDASDHYSLLKNDAHEQTTLCEPRRLIDVTGNIYKD
uniref:Uncharacterized protein n=1 Tax=Oryza barthii TaxID=65489 RepID=A0A0D3GYN6_9ORYZ